MVIDCAASSTKTRAAATSAGSSSCLPLVSAPIALTCVPGLTHSRMRIGFCDGVTVTMMSAARATASGELSAMHAMPSSRTASENVSALAAAISQA
jgi:hypothetical protein